MKKRTQTPAAPEQPSAAPEQLPTGPVPGFVGMTDFRSHRIPDRETSAALAVHEAAAAAAQNLRSRGGRNSAISRREKNVGRDRRIHDALTARKTRKQISLDSGTKINKKGEEVPVLSISQVNKILAKPRP
jgi:hypothetical protein